jgi:hypothetical protein
MDALAGPSVIAEMKIKRNCRDEDKEADRENG